MLTGAERGHGQRGSSRDSGGGTGEVGHEEEEGKEKGCRQVGSSWGMTEKEGVTEKRTGKTERKEEMTERKEGMTDLLFYFLPFLFQTNSILFEFNSYALNQIKLMHQHECTNMLNLK
jgi:hypothetical protein